MILKLKFKIILKIKRKMKIFWKKINTNVKKLILFHKQMENVMNFLFIMKMYLKINIYCNKIK